MRAITEQPGRKSFLRRLAWFVGLWCLGVACILLLAALIRLAMP